MKKEDIIPMDEIIKEELSGTTRITFEIERDGQVRHATFIDKDKIEALFQDSQPIRFFLISLAFSEPNQS